MTYFYQQVALFLYNTIEECWCCCVDKQNTPHLQQVIILKSKYDETVHVFIVPETWYNKGHCGRKDIQLPLLNGLLVQNICITKMKGSRVWIMRPQWNTLKLIFSDILQTPLKIWNIRILISTTMLQSAQSAVLSPSVATNLRTLFKIIWIMTEHGIKRDSSSGLICITNLVQ